MKKFKRIISLLLTVTMLVGTIASLTVINVGAADDDTEFPVIEVPQETVDYTKQEFNSPQAKIDTMTLYLDKGNYQLYVDTYSGETATVNKVTGEILFSNPYDVGYSTAADTTKNEILSQLIVKFSDTNDNVKVFSSYEYAAMRNQIKVKNIKNGVRIEYTIGREEARILVPRLIRAERFENLIYNLIVEGYNEQYGEDTPDSIFWIDKFSGFFQKYSIEGLSGRAEKEILALYPICKKMDIYACDAKVTEVELNRLEEVIKTFCPEYSFDELDADHEETGYVAEDQNPPVFKMALEYFLDETGVSVRLPSNGIRYDESLYQVDYISVLPYMGSGHSANTGYTFFPDGSGAIFRFEDLKDETQTTVSGKIYGTDYAYHTITGTYQKQVTAPVFGLVENQVYYEVIDSTTDTTEYFSATVKDYETLKREKPSATINVINKDSGFFAIIEDGESLATLSTTHDGAVSEYNHITMTFNPKPKDEYKLADSISVVQDANASFPVVSDRKYTGDFRIKYVMLTDDAAALETNTTDYYECTYTGMATAYRDYLIANGTISALGATSATSGNVTKDIPLYIEVFGAVETTQQILSMPVNVMTPLTTFEDVMNMYKELAYPEKDENGEPINEAIKNINFKMTGFMNGGIMDATAPYRLKWERNVGGKSGLKELISYATGLTEEDENLGLYPDANFAFVQGSALFDGYSTKKHAVRTIDDRYTSRRYYSATRQKYMSYFEMAVSPAYYAHFYEKFMKSYDDYKIGGISLGTLGYSLNSDFDEDEPFNREDNKKYTIQAFEYISSKVDSVMTDKANAYSWKYVDHILDLALDSSRYTKASASVPFLGMVLHGYKQYAGEPLNMEGDTDYAMLKAIESGASLYFVLSAQNTEELKENYQYSKYYSINYKNWKESLIESYTKLNAVLADVQFMDIINHEFLENATRVLDASEIKEMLDKEIAENEEYQANLDAILALEALVTVSNARKASKAAESLVISYKGEAQEYLDSANEIIEPDGKLEKQIEKLDRLKLTYDRVLEENNNDENAEAVMMVYYQVQNAKQALLRIVTDTIQYTKSVENILDKANDTCLVADEAVTIITNAEGTLQVMIDEAVANAAAAKSHIAEIEAMIVAIKAIESAVIEGVDGYITQEEIDKRLEQLNSSNSGKVEEEEEEIDTKYVADSSKIVAVTYGKGFEAYKTFLLNYNSYSVILEYGERTYCIDAGEFVEIFHNN